MTRTTRLMGLAGVALAMAGLAMGAKHRLLVTLATLATLAVLAYDACADEN